MDVTQLDPKALHEWWVNQFLADDICGGQVPSIDVQLGETRTANTYPLGQLHTALIKVSSLEATEHETFDDLLDYENEADDVLTQCAKLILNDAVALDQLYFAYDSIEEAAAGIPHTVQSIIFPWRRKTSRSIPQIPPKLTFASRGVTDIEKITSPDETQTRENCVFVHSGLGGKYIIKPIIHIKPQGPQAYLRLTAELVRRGEQRPVVSPVGLI